MENMFDTLLEPLEETFKDCDKVLETAIIDSVSMLSNDKIEEFCKRDGIGEQLLYEGKISESGLTTLKESSKVDRLVEAAALELAKKANDPLWDKLVEASQVKNTVKNALLDRYINEGKEIIKKRKIESEKNKVLSMFE